MASKGGLGLMSKMTWKVWYGGLAISFLMTLVLVCILDFMQVLVLGDRVLRIVSTAAVATYLSYVPMTKMPIGG